VTRGWLRRSSSRLYRERGNIADAKLADVLAVVLDGLKDVRGGLFSEAGEDGHFSGLARALEFGDRVDAERIPEDLNFLGAEPLKLEKAQDVRRELIAEVVVVFEFSIANEGGYFFGGGFADPVHRLQSVFLDEFLEGLGKGFQRAGRVRIRADLERILVLEFEQPRDVFKDDDDVVFAHSR